MILKDRGELVAILRFQQVLNSSLGKFRERLVCRRKYSKGALAFQGFD